MKSIAKRKTTTSTEVKQRWINENYKRYGVSLRFDTDKALIDYLEENKGPDGKGVTDIFRAALSEHIKRGG